MKVPPFLAVLLIYIPMVPVTHNIFIIPMVTGIPSTFQKLIISNNVSPCAADTPTKVFPLAEISSVPQCVPYSALCSWKCDMEPNCTCYNVYENQCQLYDYIPINFVNNATCEHFKGKINNGSCALDKATPYAGAFKMIPVQCCSFPFTLNGAIYYNCTKNANAMYPNSPGCYMDRRVWVYCSPPSDFTAEYYNGSVIIPTKLQPMTAVFIDGWFIIQKHDMKTGTIFNKTWTAYRSEFGDGGDNYWFGNENLYLLTTVENWKLRMEVESNDTGKWYSAEYETFQLSNNASGYVLNVSGYSGDAGDSLNHSNVNYKALGMKFSTYDKDNDGSTPSNCAASAGGGWWWNYCGVSGLNAQNGGYNSWGTLFGIGLAPTRFVSRSRMMMKRN